MEAITVYTGEGRAAHPCNVNYALYMKSWDQLHRLIELKMNNISRSIFDKLIHFIDSSHRLAETGQVFSTGTQQTMGFIQPNKQIPTAVVLAGVNTPDHQLIYDQIQASVRGSGGHVAVVNPGPDTVTSRSLMCAVVRQFIQAEAAPVRNYDMGPDSDEEIDSPVLELTDSDCYDDFLKRFTLSVRFTYWALSQWYHHRPLSHPKSDATSESVKFHTPRLSRRSLSQPDPEHVSTRTRPGRASLFTQGNRTGANASNRSHSVRRFTTRPGSKRANHGQTEVLPNATMEPTSPPSSLAVAGRSGPLVIILPRIEAIPSHVLQDFIELTSSYASGQFTEPSLALPICLVLGLSTTPEVGFEARLNASTLGRLRVEWFTVPPPAVFLDAVFSALLEFPGFRPSHSMCTYLVDSLFLCLDYSVRNFVRRLQFCMLDHYLSLPHPELLLPADQARAYLDRMPSTALANMVSFSFPSVAYLAAHDSPSPPRLPTTLLSSPSGQALTQRLAAQLEAHWHLQYLVGPVLIWLFHLASPGAVAPLGKSVSELYRRWLKDGLIGSEEFKLFKELMGGLSKEPLIRSTTAAASALDNEQRARSLQSNMWPDSVRVACDNRLSELSSATRKWLGILSSADIDCSSPPPNRPSPVSPTPTPCQTPSDTVATIQSFGPFDRRKKISLRGLRQHLQEVAAASSPAPHGSPARQRPTTRTNWECKRAEFVSWVVSQLTELIPFPTSLPMHEVFYGPITVAHPASKGSVDKQQPQWQLPSEWVVLRRRLNPPLQKCLHQALVDPGTYLQIPELKLDSVDSLNASLPDISILYKLYLESTKLINLHDWLMAFASVLDSNGQSDAPPNKLIQARFFHGIAQLHHMGYIKSTRRKADHVMRLSWGLVA